MRSRFILFKKVKLVKLAALVIVTGAVALGASILSAVSASQAQAQEQADEEESDFICLHLGSKGTIASCGGVTVRATRIKKDNTK